MTVHEQFVALRAAIRCCVDARHGDTAAAARLCDLAASALQTGVPPRLLLPVVSIARAVAAEGCGQAVLPALARRPGVASANGEQLEELGRQLDAEGQPTAETLLLGDAALLALLYDDATAFPLRLTIAGVRGTGDGHTQLERHLRMAGGQPVAAPLGPLAGVARRDGRAWAHAGRAWRLPSRELLLALLIARVGDPLAHPDPPLWHHLAIALGVWRETLDHQRLVDLGARLELAAPLGRGIALLVRLLPELAPPAATRLPPLSWPERTLAVPLAARKLVAVSLAPELSGPSASPLPLPALQAS
jgi:hypothetical protein